MEQTETPPTSDVVDDVKVWLIEDNAAFRNTVSRVINHMPGIHCTGAFATCEEALKTLGAGSVPEVILLDVGLPGMNGIDGIKEIKAISPTTHVIMLTVFDDHDKIFNAICAGASGYLLKGAPEEGIAKAIKDVLSGGAPMNPRIARTVLDMFSKLNPPPKDYGLTARERQILELMVQGHIKKQIASELSLSFHTVDTHLRNIYSKLQVHTRTSAVAKALKERLF